MITEKIITRKLPEYSEIVKLYKREFPASERMPMFFMNLFAKRKSVRFVAFYDDEKFVGFAYLITHKTLTYLFFFAVKSSEHSKGYGSKILTFLRERYAHNRIVLVIEELSSAAENNAQRIRRRDFYIKNGYVPAGFRQITRYDNFDVYIIGGSVTKEELGDLVANFAGKLLNLFFKMKLEDYENLE
jgi:ribosomal protein S18 acetylase RimI-like enzyme